MREERKVKGTFDSIDGNAFMLMGYFQKLAKEQGISKEWIQGVLDEAKSKDYNHLITTLLENMEDEEDV